MKKSIITDFSGYENDELDEKGDTIDVQITANAAALGTLPIAPAVFHTHLTAFSGILGMPVYPEKTADLNTAKKLILSDLRKNGVHINEFADGDEVVLAKSGYPLAKDPAPVGPLAKATFKNIVSTLGGFDIELNPIAHAKGYIVCVIPTIDLTEGGHGVVNKFGKWPWYHSSNTKIKITDLDSSKKYTIVAVALGTDPTLTYSDPIERTTQ